MVRIRLAGLLLLRLKLLDKLLLLSRRRENVLLSGRLGGFEVVTMEEGVCVCERGGGGAMMTGLAVASGGGTVEGDAGICGGLLAVFVETS